VLDFGYNSGPSRSIRFAQIVVGATPDGILGPLTLNAINAYDPRLFINGLCDARLNFMRGLRTWDTFGAGWSARVQDLRTYSLNLAFPPAKAPLVGYTDKLMLIPMAFGKAWEGS
jgi:lysozyme family protein